MESRITELENRLSFLEKTLSDLNEVITKQDATLLQLEQQNRELILQVQSLGEMTGSASVNADSGHEIPPHY